MQWKKQQKNNNKNKTKKLELAFIKHYAPNSLHLTVKSHHVLFVKMLAKFSKGHNSGKNKMIFKKNLIR